MRKTLALTLAFAACTPAHAQPVGGFIPLHQCGKTQAMIAELDEEYNERLIAGGTNGTVLLDQFYLNEETGSFTILRSNIEAGVSCIISFGDNGQMINAPAPVSKGPKI